MALAQARRGAITGGWPGRIWLVTVATLFLCGLLPTAAGGQDKASSASPLPDVTSTSIPNTPAGMQLQWLLGAIADLPIPDAVVGAHFDAGFLKQIGTSGLNAALGEIPGSPTFAGVLVSQGSPGQNPSGLLALVDIGTTRYEVTLATDAAGLIASLLFTRYLAPPTSWTAVDHDLAQIGPEVSFLSARVTSTGACDAIHSVAPTTARPLGSMFKLFVLGAVARRIVSGRSSWGQELTVEDALKSLPSGTLQNSPQGTQITVLQAAMQMISISDNTAADLLIHLVGRAAVEAQVRAWSDSASRDTPFLTTRELFVLKQVDYPKLARQYLALKPAARSAFLARSVDPLTPSAAASWTSPRQIDSLEWFASPSDICRAFVGLQKLQNNPALAPIDTVLSTNDGGLSLDANEWPTVWFKGGSEPGLLTLGYLAENAKGQTYVVVAMVSNPAQAISNGATLQILSIMKGAFGLLGARS